MDRTARRLTTRRVDPIGTSVDVSQVKVRRNHATKSAAISARVLLTIEPTGSDTAN